MRKSNSTTPRYRHPSSFYSNAHQIQLTLETESHEMQKLIVSRLFAMAEYLFSTPAGGVLGERMYIALADAWQRNRNTHGDTSQNPWDHSTVDHHTAILHAINYADGNCEDVKLDGELEAIRQTSTTKAPKPIRSVTSIEEWKRSRYGESGTSDES
jgi:hypothetical protein